MNLPSTPLKTGKRDISFNFRETGDAADLCEPNFGYYFGPVLCGFRSPLFEIALSE
jgi:hypothetical protein